jgi:hypothetical protein
VLSAHKKAGEIMDRKEYFKKLISLFEAEDDNIADPKLDPVVDPGSDVQQDIEKTSDITDTKLDSELKPQDDALGGEGDMLSDSDNLLSDEDELPFGDEPQAESPEQVSEKVKLQRLFDLYKELIEYERVFVDSLTNIDSNLLDADKNTKIVDYKNRLSKLEEKLKTYTVEVFHTEKYERALYNYVLMRTELLTIVKLLRDVLSLDDSSDKPIQKVEETKENEQQ